MARIAYVNGEFVPLDQARVSVLDRGFLFADGIYEVTAVIDGRLVDYDGHVARLERSLGEIGMAMPVTRARLAALHDELIRLNGLVEGGVYLQVTRGAAEREFAFPQGVPQTLVMFTQARDLLANPKAETGIAVISVPDIRWKRRDIKSVALLAQVLAKEAARAAGCGEAWMVEDGLVTEGGSSNAYVVTSDGVIVTRPLSNAILAGVTRRSLLALVEERGLALEERAFTLSEAHDAAEAFITSATTFVMPVVRIDDRPVGNGRPGPVTRRLREIYIATARGQAPASSAAP